MYRVQFEEPTMSQPTRIQPDQTLDARGRSCPGPVLEAKRLVSQLARGQVLLLISDCPGTQSDLQSWARQTGRELIEVSDHAEGGKAYYVRNGDPWPATTVLDMRGRPCPAPVVEAEKALHAMAAGEVLKLLSDCSGFADDLGSWARSTHHQVLGTVPGPAGSEVSYIQG